MKNFIPIEPKELNDIINSDWYQDEGCVAINKLEYVNDDINIEFSLETGEYETPNQVWRLTAKSVKSNKINLDWGNNFQIFNDHFLLWEFNDHLTRLYFSGDGNDQNKLFVDFHKMHKSLYEKYFDIDKYINSSLDLINLCNSNVGLFAAGPMKILENYYECLKRNDRNPYYESYSKPEIDEQVLLLILGKSYLIAKNFTFEKLT